MYHKKALEKYIAQSDRQLSSMGMVARLMELAADSMGKVHKALYEKDYMASAKASEKVILILGSLEKAFHSDNPEHHETIKGLRQYFQTMETLVVRVNLKRNVDLALGLQNSFKNMATEWWALDKKTAQEATS